MFRTLRIFLGALILMVGVLAAQAQSDPVITYETSGQTLEAILGDLSEQTGAQLLTSPQTAKEVLAIRMTAPLSKLLSAIADATGYSWSREGSAFRLVFPSSDRQADARAAVRVQAQRYREAVARDVAEMSPEFDADGLLTEVNETFNQAMTEMGNPRGMGRIFRQAQGLIAGLPGGRAIVRMLSEFDDEQWNALASGRRVVFATNPTRMQVRLPARSADWALEVLKEQQALAAAAQSTTVNPMVLGILGLGMEASQRLQNPRPAKVYLVASPLPVGGSIVNMAIVDAEGEALVSGFYTLDLGISFDEEVAEAPAAPAAGTPFSFSEEDLAVLAAIGSGGSMGAGPGGMMQVRIGGPGGGNFAFTQGPEVPEGPLPENLRARLADPVTHEPLAPVGAAILQWAGASDVVAVLPDGLLAPAATYLTTAPEGIEGFSAKLDEWGMAVTNEGYVQVVPRNAAASRAQRVDREALAQLLASYRTEGSLRLDPLARYATAAPSAPSLFGVDAVALRLAGPGELPQEFFGFFGFGDRRELLELYALMNPATALGSDTTRDFQIGTLGQSERELIASMVFDSMEGPEVARQREGRGGRGQGGMRMSFGGPGFDAAEERTEVLASGLPPNGVLRVTESREVVVRGVTESGEARSMTARELGTIRALSESPIARDWNRNFPVYESFLLGERVTYTFEFTFAPGVTMTRRLSDDVAEGQALRYAQLPESFRTEAEAAYAEMTENLSNAQSRGNRPAPPRTP